MSVLIKGMEMPKTGRYFVAIDNTDGKDKTVISIMSEFERGDKTRPLLAVHEIVPVPPHGRCIDADALMAKDRQIYLSDGTAIGIRRYIEFYEIDDAPTIIPAEPAEEGET